MAKIKRTFSIDGDLSARLDKFKRRSGDMTYHVEKALKMYLPTIEAGVVASVPVVVKAKTPVKRFVPPTFAEAANAFLQLGSQTCQDDATAFIDFYESNGWKVGKNKMKSWTSALSGWHRRNEKKAVKKDGIFNSTEWIEESFSGSSEQGFPEPVGQSSGVAVVGSGRSGSLGGRVPATTSTSDDSEKHLVVVNDTEGFV